MGQAQSFPLSRESDNVRLPLDHPGTEAIAKRIQCLLGMDALSDDDRGNLRKKYRDLHKADSLLARKFFGRPLPITDLRPQFWNDWRSASLQSGIFVDDQFIIAAGFVQWVREWVDTLERRYGDNACDDI